MSTAEVRSAATVEPIAYEHVARTFWSPAIYLALVAQAERAVGLGVALASRWFLSPTDLGIYSGLRILLDNTNRSSLGVALGAIQKSIAMKARQADAESDRVLAVAATTNAITSSVYGAALACWGIVTLSATGDFRWGIGLALVGLLAVIKRQQDFQVAVLRSRSAFSAVGHINLIRNLAFGLCATAGILAFGFWGLVAALGLSFLVERRLLRQEDRCLRFPIVWDWHASLALAATGLPILAANSAWACVTTLDRALILSNLNGGTELAGYYSIAVLGSGILEDFASRIALVISTAYRSEFGRDGSVESILERAETTGLAILGLLAPAGFALGAFGTKALPWIFPNLAPGAEALMPMIPGTIALCAAMPLREAWISTERPWIPTILAGLGASFIFLRISTLGSNGTIADVAFESSICRGATCLGMFALPAIFLKWNRARLGRWAATSIWASAWFIALDMFRNDELEAATIALIAVTAIPAMTIAWHFDTGRKVRIATEGAE